MSESDYVNIREASRILGLSMPTVKKAINAGELPVIKLGTRIYRIPRSALVAKLSKANEGDQEV